MTVRTDTTNTGTAHQPAGNLSEGAEQAPTPQTDATHDGAQHTPDPNASDDERDGELARGHGSS